MDHQVITLARGQPEYADLLDQIRQDPALVNAMREHAESCPDELDRPGTWWTVAIVDGAPAAWCAARVDAGELRCHSNYEHPGYRGHGLYAAAYRERHDTVVEPSNLAAVTYLFSQPIGLHESDGWYRTGVSGVSTDASQAHEWWELRRDPTG
jgi:hypothetical protein